MRVTKRQIHRLSLRASALGIVVLTAAGCGLQPDPPPQFNRADFSGTGDKMAACMQFASESYCEREIWGGNER